MKSDENKCRQLLESNKLPAALWNTCGQLLDANQLFCDLIGYSEEQIRDGQASWSALTVPELRDRDCRFLEEVNATGFCRPYEEVFQNREGHPKPAIIGGARLESERDRAIAFALDISSIQQSSDVLATIEERISLLSQVIWDIQDEFVPRVQAEDSLRRGSHEFQSLAEQFSSAKQLECEEMIQLLYDGLQHMLVGTSFHNSLMERRRDMRHATTMTANIVSKSIQISRSLATELSLSILHEGKLVPTLTWLAGSMRDRYGLDVNLAVDDGVEFAYDEVKLLILQAVRELLMNVIKHSGVRLAWVTAAILDTMIQFEVEDDGSGFDPKRLESDVSNSGGLATLRERVRKSGGQLQVFSAPGLGARCSIVLPHGMRTAQQQTAEHDQNVPAHMERTSGKRIHVLLVDDHTVIRQGIIALLKRESDLEIVGEACNGESAVELARAVQPDVVLMDIYMPGMGGVQATRLIHDQSPHVRVIGLSMLEEREMALLMHEAGAVGYLTKNGPSEALISAIRACA